MTWGSQENEEWSRLPLPTDYQEFFAEMRRLSEAGTIPPELQRISEKLARDIQEGMERDAQSAYNHIHDPLTGLLNAQGLEHRFNEIRSGPTRNPTASNYIGALDLDNFKQINDEYGHAAGDEALRLTATYLREAVKETDAVARLHGDEFALIAYRVGPAMRSRAELKAKELSELQDADAQGLFGRVASHVNAGLRQYVSDLGGTEAPVGASIGAVRINERNSFEETLHRADKELYRAKRRGKGLAVVRQTHQ